MDRFEQKRSIGWKTGMHIKDGVVTVLVVIGLIVAFNFLAATVQSIGQAIPALGIPILIGIVLLTLYACRPD